MSREDILGMSDKLVAVRQGKHIKFIKTDKLPKEHKTWLESMKDKISNNRSKNIINKIDPIERVSNKEFIRHKHIR